LPARCVENDATNEVPGPDARCEPAWFVDGKGIRRARQECLRDSAQPAAAAPPNGVAAKSSSATAASGSQPDGCAQPYWVDQHDIKRLEMRCLGPSISAAAVPALASVTPVPSSDRKQVVDCTTPFWADQHGIKRMKMQCL